MIKLNKYFVYKDGQKYKKVSIDNLDNIIENIFDNEIKQHGGFFEKICSSKGGDAGYDVRLHSCHKFAITIYWESEYVEKSRVALNDFPYDVKTDIESLSEFDDKNLIWYVKRNVWGYAIKKQYDKIHKLAKTYGSKN